MPPRPGARQPASGRRQGTGALRSVGVTRLLVVVVHDTDPPARLGQWLRDAGHGARRAAPGRRRRAARRPSTASTGWSCWAARSRRWTTTATSPGAGRRPRRCCGQALAADFPTLAICLGAQLLAQVGGGTVRAGIDGPEVGATAGGQARRRRRRPAVRPAAALAGRAPVPPRRDLRAARPARRCWRAARMYANQAFRVGRHVYGLQFHIETDAGDHPRVGRAGRRRRRRQPARPRDDLPAVRRRPTPTSRRPGRRSPAGSPTWCAPAPAGPPDAHEQRSGGDPAPGRRPAGPVRLRGRRAGRRACCPTPPSGCGTSSATSPPTPRPGPVIAALARAGDPDLALRSLHRLVEALDQRRPLGRHGRRAAGRACAARALLRSRLLAVLGRQLRAGRPPRRPPRRLDGPGGRRRRHPPRLDRPVGEGAAAADAGRRRRRPGRPAVGRAAGQGRARTPSPAAGRARCGWPTAGRSSPSPGATWGRGCPPRRSPPSWPTSPPPCSPPAWRSPSPSSRPSAAACRLAVIALGKTGGRELNYVSDVDVVFVAEPVDPSDPESAALTSATRVAAALMRICREAAWEVDAALRPGGQGRRARAHPGRAPGLLRAVGEHLGVPGAAEDAPGGRRPRPRPRLRRRALAAGVEGRRPAGLRRRGAGDAPPGRGQHPARAGRAGAQARPRRACATSSSPSSCCRWCTAGSTPRCGSAARCRRCRRCRPAATSGARTPPR